MTWDIDFGNAVEIKLQMLENFVDNTDQKPMKILRKNYRLYCCDGHQSFIFKIKSHTFLVMFVEISKANIMRETGFGFLILKLK